MQNYAYCDPSWVALPDEVRQKWDEWLASGTRAHVKYEPGPALGMHFQDAFANALSICARAVQEMEDLEPNRILDLGSATGFKALALQHLFPNARITGIDPDHRAIDIARTMASHIDRRHFPHTPTYVVGAGEHLPYPDQSFDLIICAQVIEHVQDVNSCLNEIARVLKSGGYLYIEAPNYIWPLEPHLGILVPPLCPKPIMRLLARLQGAGGSATFVDHLRLVHPFWVERKFTELNLCWTNGFSHKLEAVLSGRGNQAVYYQRLQSILKLISRLGIRKILVKIIIGVGFYPSLIYVARRKY